MYTVYEISLTIVVVEANNMVWKLTHSWSVLKEWFCGFEPPPYCLLIAYLMEDCFIILLDFGEGYIHLYIYQV